MSVYGFAGRGAFERNVRAMRAAERASHTPAALLQAPGFVPIPVPVHCHVTVVGPKVPDDRRNCYPGEISFRQTDAVSPGEDWQPIGEDADDAGAPCVAVTLHGEVLRKDVRYEGRIVGTFEVTTLDEPLTATLSFVVPPDAATLTLPADHGLVAGDRVQVVWDLGLRSEMEVTGVVADVAQVVGGIGDSLPADGTTVAVARYQTNDRPVALVDCTDAVEIIRTTARRNADGDYQGFVQEWDADAGGWRDGEEVWVRNAN